MTKLRRPGVCSLCSVQLDAGVEASWSPERKTVTCAGCVASPSPHVSSGIAGQSARAKAQQLRTEQDERRRELRERRPVLGRVQIALAGPSTAGASWAKGAVGEEKFGAVLDSMVGEGLLVLHDRRRPRTSANIDHIVIAPGGIWVIDAKRYKGVVARVDKGGWFRSDVRLTVGGRDRTALVAGVKKQLADVRKAVDAGPLPDVPIHGALCFIDGEFRLFAKPFEVDGVLVTWGKALRALMAAPGSLTADERADLHRHLAASLPPSVT
jgi:hypothetical protein